MSSIKNRVHIIHAKKYGRNIVKRIIEPVNTAKKGGEHLPLRSKFFLTHKEYLQALDL
jgi:hypothetical protein